MEETLKPRRVLETAQSTIRAVRDCFLVTVGESGRPHARVLRRFEPGEDLTLWFGTSPDSRKVREIRRDPAVTIAFQDTAEDAHVVLMGKIEIIEDIEKRRTYWEPSWKAFFPAGPDSGYIVLKFVPRRIEVFNLARKIIPPPFGLKAAVLVLDEKKTVGA